MALASIWVARRFRQLSFVKLKASGAASAASTIKNKRIRSMVFGESWVHIGGVMVPSTEALQAHPAFPGFPRCLPVLLPVLSVL